MVKKIKPGPDFLRKFRPVEVVGVDENGTDFNPVGFLFNVS